MFFGWYVVAGTFTAQLLVVGFFSYSVSLLVGPVREEFGVSLEQVLYSMSLGTLFSLAVVPLCGALIDRYPVRWLISGGVVLFALGLWWTGNSSSITEYVVVFGLTFCLANALAGPMASSAVVSRWFTRSRGKALGIAAMGTSVGGILVPALVNRWIINYGWREAMENLALLAVLVVLPVVILSVRGRPGDIGLQVEEQATGEGSAPTPGLDLGLTTRQILTNPSYWYIALTLGTLFCVYSAMLSILGHYATDLGYRPEQAASLIMILAISGLVGKLLSGLLADRLNLKFGLWAAIGLVAVAFVLLALEPVWLLVVLAVVMMGLAAGGMLPVWGAMMAKAFGLVSYGKAMGLMGPVITLAVLPGFTLMGRLYDLSGNYQLGISVFAGVTVLAAVLLIPLKLEEPA